MMTTIETYVRRSRGDLRKWAARPQVRRRAGIAACFLGGFVLSAASLANVAVPLAMGLVCSLSGWDALAAALGGAAGYRVFWGSAGDQGLLWLGLALPVALGLGKRRILEESPFLMMAIAGLIVSSSGLAFQLFLEDTTSVPRYLLRIGLGAGSAKLFERIRQRRDPAADWLGMGFGVLALSQIAPFGFSLGYVAAGAIGAWGALPAAALAGLALDLSRLTRVSMTAVLTLAGLARLVPVKRGRLACVYPGVMYLAVMGLSGYRQILPFFALSLGGVLAGYLPRPLEAPVRRGETGLLQVRLEEMAQALSQTRQLLAEAADNPIDTDALLGRTRERACTGCPHRKNCTQRLQPLPSQLLQGPLTETSELPPGCKKPGRLLLELRRTRDQYRALRADRERQQEYRTAVIRQYRFLGAYLQQQADSLPFRQFRQRQRYTPEVAVCSAGKESANGDRCAAFMGTQLRYYMVLCDGMGTGPEAAREAQSALTLLRRMLSAGFPAEYALDSLNSLLVLRGSGAAVTVDLAQIRLDSGRAEIYKWGAAPSWLIYDGTAEKIGTAGPPPGLSLSEGRETVERLSLRRGEVLILTSDGVEVDGTLRRERGVCALPPGELAAKLLEYGSREREDDATVAAVRLRGGVLST